MQRLEISAGAERVLEKLNNAGFSAYVVGGAVRDLIMGKTPHDYDIATSAKPEQVKHVFRRTIDTGIKHGTVTVVEDRIAYEITTFRCDGAYTDGRHPASVDFVNDARKDCARRDFTVNAMMYSRSSGVLDYFGGISDIQNRVIRCVGEPEKRFNEDALRMLRAVRFRAELDFVIDMKTEQAIRKCAAGIKRVSSERIQEELNKILLSPHPEYIRELRRLMPQRCTSNLLRNCRLAMGYNLSLTRL